MTKKFSTNKRLTLPQCNYALNRWRQHQLTCRENKLMFGFTAKAGCSSVTKLFLSLIDHPNSIEFRKWPHPIRQAYQKQRPTRLKDWFDKRILKLKFVRNPFDRAVSSYLHVAKHAKLGSHLAATSGQKGIENWTFEDFIDRLSDINLYAANPHYGPQTWSMENRIFKFDKIIKIETLRDDLLQVENEFGRSFSIDDSLFTSRHHTARRQNLTSFCGDVPYAELLSNGIPASEHFYNHDLTRKVYKLYKRDVDRFGYPLPHLL